MKKQTLILQIKSWIKDYESNDQHDNDLTIALKDDAYAIFGIVLIELERKCNQ